MTNRFQGGGAQGLTQQSHNPSHLTSRDTRSATCERAAHRQALFPLSQLRARLV